MPLNFNKKVVDGVLVVEIIKPVEEPVMGIYTEDGRLSTSVDNPTPTVEQ